MNDVIQKLLEWRGQLGEEEITESMDDILVEVFTYLADQERLLFHLRKKTASYEYFLQKTDQIKYFDEEYELKH